MQFLVQLDVHDHTDHSCNDLSGYSSKRRTGYFHSRESKEPKDHDRV